MNDQYRKNRQFGLLILIIYSIYHFNNVALAQTINTHVSERDFICFDNAWEGQGGQCFGMAVAVALSPALFIFDPTMTKRSDAEILDKLVSAYENEIPVVIEGIESFEELSHEPVTRQFVQILQKKQFLPNVQNATDSYGRPTNDYEYVCDARSFRDYYAQLRSVNLLLDELRAGRPIVIDIGVTPPSNTSLDPDHTVVITGVAQDRSDGFSFNIYDPNMPHQKKIQFFNRGDYDTGYHYNDHETHLCVRKYIFEKIKRAYERKQRIEKIRNSLEASYTGFGYIVKKLSGLWPFQESGLFLKYGNNFIPLESDNYQLEALANNNRRVFIDGDLTRNRNSIKVDKVYYETIKRLQIASPENHVRGYIEQVFTEGATTFYLIDDQGKKYELHGKDAEVLKTFLGTSVSVNGDMTEFQNKTYLQIKEVIDLQPLVPRHHVIPPRLTKFIMLLRNKKERSFEMHFLYYSRASLEETMGSVGELAIEDLVKILNYGNQEEKLYAKHFLDFIAQIPSASE